MGFTKKAISFTVLLLIILFITLNIEPSKFENKSTFLVNAVSVPQNPELENVYLEKSMNNSINQTLVNSKPISTLSTSLKKTLLLEDNLQSNFYTNNFSYLATCSDKFCKKDILWNYLTSYSTQDLSINCEDLSKNFVSILRKEGYYDNEVFVAHLKVDHAVVLLKEKDNSWLMYDPLNKKKGYYEIVRIYNDRIYAEII